MARTYLELFLAVAVPFGLMVTGYVAWMDPALRGLGPADRLFPAAVEGVHAGIRAGGIFSLLFGTLHILSVDRLTSGAVQDPYAVRQARTVDLECPGDEAFNLCIAALLFIGNTTVRKRDPSAGQIVATVGLTWKSLGEVIEIDVAEADDGRSTVRVSSRPALFTTVADLGKNLENVEAILGYLRNAGSAAADAA